MDGRNRPWRPQEWLAGPTFLLSCVKYVARLSSAADALRPLPQPRDHGGLGRRSSRRFNATTTAEACMRSNLFREKLKRGPCAIGIYPGVVSPELVEFCGLLGFDWV